MGNFYETLGISKSASDGEIKKAYRKLAMTEHPDKGGNAEKFKEISEAYDVLSDPVKRKRHDAEGMFDFGFPFGAGAFPFENVFGFRQPQTPRTFPTDPITEHVMITLEEAFRGCKKQVKVQTRRYCPLCVEPCKACQGTGKKEVIRRIGPMIQTMIAPCENCGGSGSCSKRVPSCQTCQGRGVREVFENIELDLPPGVQTDDQYGFSNQGNHEPGKTIGDVLIRIHVTPSTESKLTVVGANLVLQLDISLADAICGTTFSVLHPQATMIIPTRTIEHGVIDPKKRYVLSGRGMPKKGKDQLGDLVITFQIRFSSVPTHHFSEQDVASVRRILSEE